MKPLAERLRPGRLEDFVAEPALLRSIKPFLEGQYLSSLILWGPPGSGKTTCARLIGEKFSKTHRFCELSAVMSGVKDIKELAEEAEEQSVILFLDEIHRFNKSQQDSLLPHVESGKITLIGATTENPSFYVITPLLSRSRVIVFPQLGVGSLELILHRAERELDVEIPSDFAVRLIEASQGDARRLCTILEHLVQTNSLDEEGLKSYFLDTLPYDKSGEQHYDFASAFIKSLRGSDPDAALFYGFKMIEAGEDPRFVFRRLMIFASEDIGNADPNALRMAVAGAEAFDRIGLPEGKIPLAHVITYLSMAPKSNRSYLAMHKAIDAVRKHPAATPPLHIRNAPTRLMKGLGYGKDYQYPHDHEGGFVPGVRYLPDDVQGPFYEPSEIGIEAKIKERLKILRKA